MGKTASPADELIATIGVTAMIALAENFGGTRLYVGRSPKDSPKIQAAIGIEAATKLAAEYSAVQIIVPLARELRVIHYYRQGMSNSRIAVALGMTEKGIELMLRRAKARGVELLTRPTHRPPIIVYWRSSIRTQQNVGSGTYHRQGNGNGALGDASQRTRVERCSDSVRTPRPRDDRVRHVLPPEFSRYAWRGALLIQ